MQTKRHELCSPLSSLKLNSTSKKGAYTQVWNPYFCTCHSGNTSRSPGLKVSWVYDYSLTWLYIFAYFTNKQIFVMLPEGLASNQLVPSYWWRSLPLEHWQVSILSQQLRPIKNRSGCLKKSQSFKRKLRIKAQLNDKFHLLKATPLWWREVAVMSKT